MKIYRTVSLKLSFKHSVTLTEGQETAIDTVIHGGA